MCESCGCGIEPEKSPDQTHGKNTSHDHYHTHDHDHGHSHETDTDPHRVIEVRKNILQQNDMTAERNRGYLEAKKIRCFNVVGSPGSGKTSLLEDTFRKRQGTIKLAVIEGDQDGSLDTERLTACGVQALQVNTGYGCHLDAGMIKQALKEMDLPDETLLFIENVGNLVCPTLFDLGEEKRILVYSVAEGEDKPLKYPYMFRSAHLCLLTKTDLLPYLGLTENQFRENILKVNPGIEIIQLSVKTGENINAWYQWLGIL